jgi:uncharacterized protein CbrC (UPF0167 family)
MGDTFAQLGIPFPLFEAPIGDASEYVGHETCTLCGGPGRHCFRLDIGGAVMLRCGTCGTETGLDANDRADARCRQCDSALKFPEVAGEVLTCYQCLRAGKAAITKDTELGMVSWEQAVEGVTHGVPGLDRDDFEMVPKEDDWVGARLPREMMYELLRTPTYISIQGDQWQFCCKSPMIFVGVWSRDEFSRRAPDGDGRRYFEQIVQDVVPGLWEDELHDETGVYVFRCQHCGRVTAHWDLA